MSARHVVLVCGGRDFEDRQAVGVSLDAVNAERSITMILHGGASGADRLAGEWARSREVRELVLPADWTRYGRSAGFVRNRHMLHTVKPDLVVAFPGGRGTAHMVRISEEAGVPVRRLP